MRGFKEPLSLASLTLGLIRLLSAARRDHSIYIPACDLCASKFSGGGRHVKQECKRAPSEAFLPPIDACRFWQNRYRIQLQLFVYGRQMPIGPRCPAVVFLSLNLSFVASSNAAYFHPAATSTCQAGKKNKKIKNTQKLFTPWCLS